MSKLLKRSEEHQACRVAVVGAAGYWGSYYTKTYAQHPDCELYAIADTAEERRSEFAGMYGIPTVYSSVDELLQDGVPDICTISLPVSASHDAVLACAEAGVPIITCEKPISESLEKADEMVEVCRRRGAILSCGTAIWEFPRFPEVMEWVGGGHVGEQTRVFIPGGLSKYVTGNGCVILVAAMRLAGSEVAWVEGWTDPPEAAFTDDECGAYGRLGFRSGAVCDIPSTADVLAKTNCIGVSGTRGRAWISRQQPVLLNRIKGPAEDYYPVFLPNLPNPEERLPKTFHWAISTFVELFRQHAQQTAQKQPAGEPRAATFSSGHDYRQALEIAIALKLSAKKN
ncbi:MAG: Gfo/Idh/MocA family oxidoreductase, partial [Spirochaetales bacterium]|nr:Gfo/Idh/MocA family oxidoreductase [Spirochaetales bacterium]